MPNTHSTLTSLFSDIADAIRGKTGSSAAIVADNFPTAIANIPTGGSATIQPLSVIANGTYTASGGVDGYSPVTVNVSGGGGGGSATDPVRFIDYDGTILYSYSAEDFANLNALPANPTHTGLTSQGWNWSLVEAKAQVTAMGSCDIGQMYITNDGKTRVYISLVDSAKLSPYLGICPNGTVVVDWGDSTATDTLTGTSLTTVRQVQHIYTSTGDYVITLTVTSGSFAIFGIPASYNGSYLLTKNTGNGKLQRYYQNAIQKVELGSGVSIGDYAFYDCYSLSSITIPNGVTSIGTYAFYDCYSLSSITIPNGVTSIGEYTIHYCESLASVSIPSGVTSIGDYAFASTHLASITIPNGVTSIGKYAFEYNHFISSITLPNGVTSLGNYAFYYCYSLIDITIPNGVTSIGNNVLNYCESLVRATIPSGVTSIGTRAFADCPCAAEYHFLPTTPPTLSSTNAFTNIFSDCKIYVPYSADHSILNAYQTASNWSTYASRMVEESP